MSVISNWPATPNRIEIIVRYLANFGTRGLHLDQLVHHLSPEALRKSASDDEDTDSSSSHAVIAEDALEEAIRLGLVEEYIDEGAKHVRIVPSIDERAMSLVERLEDILLEPTSAETTGQRDFPQALAWFLAQDPESPFDFKNNVRGRVEEQCGPEVNAFGLTNASRAQNFFYWARYLGYCWRLGLSNNSSVVVPDPTTALERHLTRLLRERVTVALGDLVREWTLTCPVLDGGQVRVQVEALMPPQKRPQPRTLSRSTSLALERLERRGFIHLEQRADAESLMLDIWPDPLPFSHITVMRTANP